LNSWWAKSEHDEQITILKKLLTSFSKYFISRDTYAHSLLYAIQSKIRSIKKHFREQQKQVDKRKIVIDLTEEEELPQTNPKRKRTDSAAQIARKKPKH
jgi:hypothetical protein